MLWRGKLDLFLGFFSSIAKSKSKTFLGCLAVFIFGVALGELFPLDAIIAFGVLLVVIFFVFVFWRQENRRFLFLLLMFFTLGFWRFQTSLPDFSDATMAYHYNNQRAILTGEISGIDRRVINQKITLSVKAVNVSGKKHTVSGQALATLPLYPEYRVGQQISASCLLVTPEKIEDFDYGKYLARYDIYSLCTLASISIIKQPEQNLYSVFSLALDGLRSWLNDPVSKAVSEPQASVLQGMVTGVRGGIPAYWLDGFKAAGITHIIAISGTNITIISAVFMFVAIGIGFNRKKAFWLAALGIIVYLFVVGDQASAIRAGLMGIIMFYGKKIGRLGSALNAILFSAFLMLLFNPQLLLNDAGFQLSYLAFIGIIYLAPLIEPAFIRLPDFLQIKEMVIMTVSAQIITLPLILFSFHRLSLVAIVVNILVLPVVPFLTVYGLINVLAAAIWLPLGQVLGFVSWLAISYIFKVVEWSTSIPFASVELKIFNSVLLVLAYSAIIFWLAWPKLKSSFIKIENHD